MAPPEPVAPNPFARFAYQPPEPSNPSGARQTLLVSTVPSRKSPRKRKATDHEDVVDVTESDSIQKKKQPTGPDSKSLLGSKKVKVYDNLRELDDHLQIGLDIVFCGINPGEKSSQIGHHYANPTNHFWSCLHQSGFTSRLVDHRKDYILPQEFSIGLTNLVDRATVEQSELSKAEQISGVPDLMKKISKHRPRFICFVGLGIADIVKLALMEKGKRLKSKTAVGLQPYKMVYPNGSPCETLFYAVSSTSGRVVRYQKVDKIQQFADLRVLVEKTRNESFDTEGLTSINAQSPILED